MGISFRVVSAGTGGQRSAARAATAMMVRAGFALPWVGSTLPSVM